MWWIAAIGVAFLAAGGYVFYRSRPPREDPYFAYTCPHCEKKLHHRRSRAGHRGVCPRCKKVFTIPSPPAL